MWWFSFTGRAGGVRLGLGLRISLFISTSASLASPLSCSEEDRLRSVCSFMADAMALCWSLLSSSWYILKVTLVSLSSHPSHSTHLRAWWKSPAGGRGKGSMFWKRGWLPRNPPALRSGDWAVGSKKGLLVVPPPISLANSSANSSL